MSDRPQFNILTRASVAAPVTSLEQAEGRPLKPTRSHKSNTTEESKDNSNAKKDSEVGAGSVVENNSSKSSDKTTNQHSTPSTDAQIQDDSLKETGVPPQEQQRSSLGGSIESSHDSASDKAPLIDVADPSRHNTEESSIGKSEASPLDEIELKKTPKTMVNIKSAAQDQAESTMTYEAEDTADDIANDTEKDSSKGIVNHEARSSREKASKEADSEKKLPSAVEKSQLDEPQMAKKEDSVEVDPLKEVSPEYEADPIEIPESTAVDTKQSSSDKSKPDWQDDTVEGKDTHTGSCDEVSPGALRRHSIAAMKELGTPGSSLNDASGSPSTPEDESAFDYPKFMESLRTKSADPIARYIKSFLQEFSRGSWTPKQQEKIVADFLKFISFKLREHEPFASMSRKERRNSMEGVEKLIMTRLYTKTFPPKMPPLLRTDGHNEDLLRDQVFEERMRLWGWVEGRHLDINNEYISHETSKSNFIQLATSELGRLHQFKSPRDKMICILNCSKVIFALIRQAQLEQNADSFLPLLIYVVLKSHPVHLVSTINYIQRFRNREFQRGETAYYLSTLASAVAFLESLDKSSLTISDEEFEQRMADSVQAESNRIIQQQHHRAMGDDESFDAFGIHGDHRGQGEGESSAAVLTASASMLVDRMRKMTTKLWEDLGKDDEHETTNRAGGVSGSAPVRHQRAPQATQDYRAQTRAAAQASLYEYENAQTQRQQFEETLNTLQNMFPLLDKDLIEDVLHQNGPNVGSAVDLCLALSS